MKQLKSLGRLALSVAFTVATGAYAGNLSNGKWTVSNCGTRPTEPVIASSDADAYNASLKQVREWQQKTQSFVDCVVGEANTDNEAIAKAANSEQELFRKSVEKISANANAIKAKLDHK